jgi:hypothetical protein
VIGGTPGTTPEALEVASFAADAIPWSGLAFKTTYWALVDWLERRHPHLSAPEFPVGR